MLFEKASRYVMRAAVQDAIDRLQHHVVHRQTGDLHLPDPECAGCQAAFADLVEAAVEMVDAAASGPAQRAVHDHPPMSSTTQAQTDAAHQVGPGDDPGPGRGRQGTRA